MMNEFQNTRDQILAEREARKKAKLAAKNKTKVKKVEQTIENANLSKNSANNLNNTLETSIPEKVINEPKSQTDNVKIKENVSVPSSCAKVADQDCVNVNEIKKTKSQLKAERRAIQEAQRSRKVLDKIPKEESKTPVNYENTSKRTTDDTSISPKKIEHMKKTIPKNTLVNIHKVKLFSHLYKRSDSHQAVSVTLRDKDIHPSIVKLGLQYKDNIIIGSNARCVALLGALRQMIYDYKTPSDRDFSRGFEIELSESVSYLEVQRPLSVSMTNAVRHLKWHLMKLPNTISDTDGQNKLQEIIDTYVKEQIETARKAICITAQQKIVDQDVILTYGFSSLIEHILSESYSNGKKFKVIIVDSGPLFEGKELLRRLVRKRICCTYVLLSAVSYIMKESTKVFLGAHGLLANGYVMSRAGTAQVALLAHSYNVPVLVCCETHKFSERVQTDAFVYNELGDPDMVMNKELWQSNNYLTPLSLMYDVTPPDLVTAVITEISILPCTSVPVVLRIKPTESILS